MRLNRRWKPAQIDNARPGPLAHSHPESALAQAYAALDANEFAEARASLAPLLATPTRRVATLMARTASLMKRFENIRPFGFGDAKASIENFK